MYMNPDIYIYICICIWGPAFCYLFQERPFGHTRREKRVNDGRRRTTTTTDDELAHRVSSPIIFAHSFGNGFDGPCTGSVTIAQMGSNK